ncbi:MAG: HAD-IA family hydrolase [Spirochaetaceae bacterium]|nr:MAG: HAD-IA family hydrolase [Spirochaetaceae bacterium]
MIKGFFFDQDGVIIDTERDGHRVAFNRTFEEFGYDVEWDAETYHQLLQISGGKERMRHHLHEKGFGKPVAADEEEELIKSLHKRKTDLFIELIESGSLPLRPGIRRFMKEVNDLGLVMGICTTSNERAATAIAYNILSDIRFDFVLAGDVVKKKKPDPEIYLLALEKCGLRAKECIVIEDSHNGVKAAKAAGMFVVATTNPYTEREDLGQADLVVNCLGDIDGEKGTLTRSTRELSFDGVLRAQELIDCFSS